MLNKSIAYRISVYVSLAVISVFITFIAIYIFFQQDLLKQNIQHKSISLGSTVQSSVGRLAITTREVAQNVAAQVVFYAQHDHAEIILGDVMRKYPFINAIHVNMDSTVNDVDYTHYFSFNMNDSIYFYQQSEEFRTCTTVDENYQKLLQKEEPSWSEPLLCKRNNNVIVFFVSPICKTNKKGVKRRVGEVICELSLNQMNGIINSLDIGERGYAFLISEEGVYLTHPEEDWILNKNVYDVPETNQKNTNVNITKIVEAEESITLIAHSAYLDNEKCWLYVTPVTGSNWKLIFVRPYSEVFNPIYLPVLQMLFFSVLGILVIYLLVTYITNREIQPLSSVTHQLKRFSRLTGDSHEIPENEIEQVSESLNYIRSWYEKYKVTRSKEEKKSEDRKRDIEQASEIQQSFIKTEFPAFPERKDIDIYATYKPARGVSGDLFDYFFIDDNHLAFTIGDVSGKGIPAAFFMSVAQRIIKNNSRKKWAKDIVSAANKDLFTNNQHQFFLTLFLGVLNTQTGELYYCNAAHTAPYIVKPNGELVDLAVSHGLPLGLYPDKKYKEASAVMEPGDSIVLYTDGVTELLDENKLQYGNSRLEENLRNLAGNHPEEMIVKIEKSLELFIGNAPQSDDISLLILQYKA